MTTYYVDFTGGSDSNTGLSEGQAWKTHTKVNTEAAAGTFSAGDSVLFKGGETWTLTGYGIQVNVCSGIYFGPYGTGRPIFDSNGSTGACVVHENAWAGGDNITIEGFELKNTNDSPAIQAQGVSNWIVRDCYIHDVTRSSFATAITFNYASTYCWIDDCQIENIDGEGIYVGRYNQPTDTTRMIWISNCTFSNLTWEAFEFKEYTRDCRVWNCTVYTDTTTTHMALLGGERHVFWNCVFDGECTLSQMVMGQYREYANGDSHHVERCLFKNVGSPTWGAIRVLSTNQTIVNCTVEGANYGIYDGNNESDRTVRNCIFTNCTYGMLIGTIGNWDCDYNLYDDEAGDVWYYDGAGRTLAYVQGTLSQEANGDNSAANFAEQTNYTLASDSNAIDAGLSSATVYDYNDKYGGTGDVDMGWREYGAWQEDDDGTDHYVFISAFHDSGSFARFTGSSGVSAVTSPTPEAGLRCMDVVPANGVDKDAHVTSLGSLRYLHHALYVNVDDLSTASGDLFDVVEFKTSGGTDVLVVQIYDDSGTVKFRVGVLDDTPAWNYTGYHGLGSGWQRVNLFWFSTPDTSLNEGYLALWLEGTFLEQLTGLNNHDNVIDQFYLGAFDVVDASTGGHVYFDVPRIHGIEYLDEYAGTLTSSAVDDAVELAVRAVLSTSEALAGRFVSSETMQGRLATSEALAGRLYDSETLGGRLATSESLKARTS